MSPLLLNASFTLDTSSHWVVSKDLVRLLAVVIILFLVYFFSFQLQKGFWALGKTIGKRIGVFSTTKDFQMQRYVYQHADSFFAKLYNWVNEQLIALNLKRQGVTPMGYMLFWGFIAVISGTIISVALNLGFIFGILSWGIIFIMMLVLTRVVVSERIERREADVMNAIDLIVPEIGNGVKNAIVMYKDNFAPSVRENFVAFINNIQDRGYSFEDAMLMLSDSLGLVFKDFAQKAIYFEAVGEKEMQDIFTDIVETNRLRRQLRDENNSAFTSLRVNFLLSVAITFGYFIFLMFTDDFSRTFFLQKTVGKLLLIVILIVVFAVLAYITTIKSKAI